MPRRSRARLIPGCSTLRNSRDAAAEVDKSRLPHLRRRRLYTAKMLLACLLACRGALERLRVISEMKGYGGRSRRARSPTAFFCLVYAAFPVWSVSAGLLENTSAGGSFALLTNGKSIPHTLEQLTASAAPRRQSVSPWHHLIHTRDIHVTHWHQNRAT